MSGEAFNPDKNNGNDDLMSCRALVIRELQIIKYPIQAHTILIFL